MSSTGVFLLVCFVGAFAAVVDRKYEPKRDVNPDCLREYGIDPESLHVGTRPFTEGEIYCVAACIYRDYGIMKPDGTIDTGVADSYFEKDDAKERQIFYAVYNACKDDNVACNLVQCMFKELRNHLGNSSSSITVNQRLLTGASLVEFA